MKRLRLFLLVFVVSCSILLSSCETTSLPADMILYGGKVITVDRNFSHAEAVAIKDGRILNVGTDEDILKLKGGNTMVIDLKGHALVPGLIEGHAHPIAASQSELRDSIPVVTTIGGLLKWIAREAQEKEDGEWIIHPKFFITRLSDMRQVTLRELDSVAPENPVFLNGSYGGVINTRALALSKLEGRSHPGVLKDERTGKPNGLIRRSAFPLLSLPKPSPVTAEEKARALKELLHLYNTVGFTSVCSGGGAAAELKLFKDLQRENELSTRIFHNITMNLDGGKSPAELIAQLRELGLKTGDGDEWVKAGALKVVLDGGMLTGTAFLHEGWGENAKELYGINDPAYRGELMYTKKELINIIAAAHATGWKFTAHVTGGGGVDTLLAAYEEVHKHSPIDERRFSVIHGNFFTDSAIAKMARMRVYADMQPAWFFKDTDLLEKILGRERLNTFHPYGSLVEAGVIVNSGSDHMVKTDPDLSINPYNPFTAMWSVITRKTEKGSIFNPEEAVTREDALKMYTINNAYASFEEDVKGSIEPGKFADLAVLSHDLMTCPPDSIRNIRSIMTIVNGNIVYDVGTLRFEDNGESGKWTSCYFLLLLPYIDTRDERY